MAVLASTVSCSEDSSGTGETNAKDLNLKILDAPYKYYNYGYSTYGLNNFNIDKNMHAAGLVLESDFKIMTDQLLDFYGIKNDQQKDFRSVIFYGKNLDLNLNKNVTGFSLVSQNINGFDLETYKIEEGKAIPSIQLSRHF